MNANVRNAKSFDDYGDLSRELPLPRPGGGVGRGQTREGVTKSPGKVACGRSGRQDEKREVGNDVHGLD
jgi:hypothetical protein